MNEDQLINTFEKVHLAVAKFLKNDGIYLERSIDDARYIEVQIFVDGHGQAIASNERDCSLQ
jgi:acetyl/propionyl-CoA carboxylase alpha subunit